MLERLIQKALTSHAATSRVVESQWGVGEKIIKHQDEKEHALKTSRFPPCSFRRINDIVDGLCFVFLVKSTGRMKKQELYSSSILCLMKNR
jgi:hypothetical protein